MSMDLNSIPRGQAKATPRQSIRTRIGKNWKEKRETRNGLPNSATVIKK
jgi:hypothetical protein